MMKASMRYCRLCNKTTKHSIVEEEIRSTLIKEVRTCTQCKITLSGVISTKDKIILVINAKKKPDISKEIGTISVQYVGISGK